MVLEYFLKYFTKYLSKYNCFMGSKYTINIQAIVRIRDATCPCQLVNLTIMTICTKIHKLVSVSNTLNTGL